MAEEAEPRVQEKPATHKAKTKRFIWGTLGLILTFLFFGFVKHQIDRANKGPSANAEEQSKQQPAEPGASRSSSQFDSLVDQSQQHSGATAPQGTSEANKSKEEIAKRSGNDNSGASGSEGQSGKIQLTPLEDAEARWQVSERIRALDASKSHWNDEKNRQANTAPNARQQPTQPQKANDTVSSARALINSPMPTNGTLEQRKAEVMKRIDAAQRLRNALQKQSESGTADEQVVQQQKAQLEQVQKGFDAPPPDIAGYSKGNSYNADIDGKLLLPPGTEIPAVFMRKGNSDFPGSQLKGEVDRDVYDLKRQYIVIPRGSQVIMSVIKSGSVNEPIQNRMAILVKWVILPNGRKIDMSSAAGLDREGIGAISDQVEYHILAQLMGVAAYAVVGGGSSYSGSGSSNDATFSGDVGEGSRKQASNIAQKYLSIVPTVTIRPGQSFYVSTEDDVYIEPWRNVYESYAK